MTRKITFPNEYSLHKFTQKNLDKLFGLEFVASEIQLDSLRFDNLAFDRKSNSFVIIEYKNVLNLEVLSQITEYYNLLMENPNPYIERKDDADNIDLSKTKVMVIGPEFTPEQIEESRIMNFPVELWKVTLFKRKKNDGFVLYENLTWDDEVEIDIDLSSLKLTQDDLLEGKSPEITELFLSLKERLCSEFEDLKMRILVDAVSFRVNNNMICISHIRNSIKTQFFMPEIKDPENRTRDISDLTTGHSANFEMTITDEKEIDYFIEIFRQAYDYNATCSKDDADLFKSLDSESRKFIRHKQGKFQLTKTINKKRSSLGTYGTLEEAIASRDELISKNESISISQTHRKEGKYGRYIAFHNKSFRVHKSINGKQRFFGAFATVEEAKKLRDILIENDWDTSKIPP